MIQKQESMTKRIRDGTLQFKSPGRTIDNPNSSISRTQSLRDSLSRK